ncbi:MAG TPA: hypothetical protein PLP61_11080 [Nocardioides sp.]|uniref:hypothetical protein n=1 Tax=Nocardioides sp. TaxID=35761 RepID=UPI002CF77FC2|nr:hypothetical protein [Nocardioides sp.]HQR27572.1 hypothetical protein [Nocardioides sp.]
MPVAPVVTTVLAVARVAYPVLAVAPVRSGVPAVVVVDKHALAELHGVASTSAQALGAGWDALLPERRALAEALYRMPAEPFQPVSTTAA